MVDLWLAVDEVPHEFGEAGAVFHDLQVGLRTVDGALDLGAVAHDADVVHQRVDLLRVIARDLLGLEIVERLSEIVALAQNRDPRQPGLETVENQFFIERAVVIFRHAPFGVVIGHVKRIFTRPGAPRQAIGMQAGRPRHATVCLGVDRTSSGSATRIARPPDVSGTAASSASATRSIRISARALPPAADPMVPTDLSPASMVAPGSGAGPSRMIRTVRVRAVPRCCIRDTTSCPT